jgi:hypothetical protein
MRTNRLILLPAAFVLLALTACGGAGGDPGADPTPSFTPAGDPTESPTAEPDPSTTAARIHVATNSVLVFAADDSPLADFTMYEPAAGVIAELTEVFGTDPAVSDSAGGLETAPSRTYDWSGFALIDYEGTTIMNTDFVINVSTASVGDIQIYTYFDLQAGDPFADAVAASDYETGFPDYTGIGSVPIDPVSVGESASFTGLAIYIGVFGSGGTITNYVAPSPNWGV